MQPFHSNHRPLPSPDLELGQAPAGRAAGRLPGAPHDAGAATHRAAGFAALREFGAQSAGTLAGLAVRDALYAASPAAVAAAGVLTVTGLGLSALRSSELIAGLAGPPQATGRQACRAVAAALPVAGGVAGVCWAAGSGTLPAATAYVAGKLVQRSVRDLCSQAMHGVLPSVESVDSQGQAVSKEDLAMVDWGRAVTGLLPTAAYFAAQEFLAPSPAPNIPTVSTLPHVAARALVEAARAATGTWTAAGIARSQGHLLRAKDGEGLPKLWANLHTLTTLRQAGDATAMRAYFGLATDLYTLLMGEPPSAATRALATLLRAELKALGEFRAPLVTRGQLALARQWRERLDALARGPAADEGPDMVGGITGMSYPDSAESVVIHVRTPAPE